MGRDHRKACCFRRFFDDELNLRVAENAIQRAKLAKDLDIFSAGMERERRHSVQVIT